MPRALSPIRPSQRSHAPGDVLMLGPPRGRVYHLTRGVRICCRLTDARARSRDSLTLHRGNAEHAPGLTVVHATHHPSQPAPPALSRPAGFVGSGPPAPVVCPAADRGTAVVPLPANEPHAELPPVADLLGQESANRDPHHRDVYRVVLIELFFVSHVPRRSRWAPVWECALLLLQPGVLTSLRTDPVDVKLV
jgi:hypothetical protein